ncbi:DUF4846 domain-containing protein [Flavihumibacter petaseus]|uniref:DUF4846 domain-containing protein n=1 Tax=Flavihumibacter petaseus TaxID=549295 RepID=UPI00147022F1|nr:DUF4846 domain-containing protein [Flavihumibacter petaseus]
MPLFRLSSPATVSSIPLPPGYNRLPVADTSITAYLRSLPLREDNRVFLFDGTLKRRQTAQYAVLNIPVGSTDLVQCADAVMLLHAKYLFSRGAYNRIAFLATDGTWLRYTDWCRGVRYSLKNNRLVLRENAAGITAMNNRNELGGFLRVVFTYAGTASLSHQLKRLSAALPQPGDVLLEGGHPGHAVLVLDVAVNNAGGRIYLLMQGYMPAQDLHVVKNPENTALNPWYSLTNSELQTTIVTPEWKFPGNSWYRFDRNW